jgi:hypothetical protein
VMMQTAHFTNLTTAPSAGAVFFGIAVCLCQATGEFSTYGTSQQHNTRIRDLREICYSWHPWHGRAVWVHATLVKRGRAVAHCSLEDIQTSRVLEVPLWMLDVVACCKTRVSQPGFASAQSLRELKEVLQSAPLSEPRAVFPSPARADAPPPRSD